MLKIKTNILQNVAENLIFQKYFCIMELVLKQPIGKLPFIGVLFEKEFEASKVNQFLVQPEKVVYYKILLELLGDVREELYINLTLRHEETNFKFTYEKLKYDIFDAHNKLKWLENTRNADLFNFGHIINKHGNHQLVKTLSTHNHFVLKVDEIKMFTEY